MKFVYFTDSHAMGRNPKYRKDNFSDALLLKLYEVGSIAEEINADAILCGGDLFDTPIISETLASKIIKIIKGFPCPVYGVAGNHCIHGYNTDTLDRTTLGLLIASGVYNLINTEGTVFYDGSVKVLVTGQDSTPTLDKDNDITPYIGRTCVCEGGKPTCSINILHSYLVPGVPSTLIPQTSIAEIDPHTLADITLTGHEHTGFGVKKMPSGKIYCNPGALGRVSANVGEVNRNVSVAIVNITSNGARDVILRPIVSARPSEEVLDRQALVEENLRKQMLKTFTEAATTAVETVQHIGNVYDALSFMGEQLSIPIEIVEEAIERVKKAEEKFISQS